ncbi:peptidoglycan-binding protein [Leptolyngbya boryana CZ1]|jgi:N-acetylmuramoyl-L-alanine amidase|uniref:Peptidoglycan-binding domain 1 protein n=4 Tax=Leptolyngbya group TaxID=3081713 RepID=A0A1Z4JMI0_LEPBY|nr:MULTISPECIES: peptidoglycan-binding protein [Leptolyngbya]MBN8560248.1 peptidoglycan-binding protein [Leptolyngbya sp. UWPOB_LEPTO1]ULP29060.1 peptidoglycan-binding protein [Leptolyngbya boryana IU 594]WNZ47403.1 peptidoglycan-binding protein [Leptolyngbya boryana CZ1]BAY57959.1 peptidoglycan-binding domain 1 protein [Leptolyngbya boryana NIES-2135]
MRPMIRLQLLSMMPTRFIKSLFLFTLAIALTATIIHPGLSQTPARNIIRLGSQGADVTELQSTLKLLGYYGGSVNGVFDESTAQAVRRFQQVAGLDADGIVGAATWNRLFPSNEPVAPPANPDPTAPRRVETTAPASTEFPILRRGATGESVRGLQSRLRAIGVYDGEVDGVFGAGTEEAVKAAQQKFGLEADGIVGGATWAAILR